MSTITLLATIGIFIEVWHLVYFNFLYERYFKRPESVIKWAESYGKLHKNFIEFSDYYLENLDLQYAIGIHFNEVLLGIVKMLQEVGGESTGRHKILKICSIKQLMLFLLQQLIEIVYWFVLLLFIVFMPGIHGVCLFIVLWLIGELQKHYNKDKKLLWINVDSVFCVLIFTVMAIYYH